LGLPNGLFPSGFPTNTQCTPLSFPIRATCPAHLILDLTTRTILSKEYRSFKSVALGIHYAQRMRGIILSSVASPRVPFLLQLINGTIFGEKVIEHKMCVLIFSTNFV
jgi:hypothetical protein